MKLLGFSLLLLLGCQSAAPSSEHAPELASVEIGQIRNVHVFGDVILAGQPTRADFEVLKKRGVETVITLRTEPEVSEFDEREIVEALGMRFISIPFREPETLTDGVFESVRAELNRGGPVVVHCGAAVRVGAVWIPWRVLDDGATLDEAVSEAHEIGLSYEPYEQRALDYIARKKAQR